MCCPKLINCRGEIWIPFRDKAIAKQAYFLTGSKTKGMRRITYQRLRCFEYGELFICEPLLWVFPLFFLGLSISLWAESLCAAANSTVCFVQSSSSVWPCTVPFPLHTPVYTHTFAYLNLHFQSFSTRPRPRLI